MIYSKEQISAMNKGERKNMLYIIGLGLNDEQDLGERAIRVAQSAECYCELYTSRWFGSIPNLQAKIKNKIELVKRKTLEEGSESFVERARRRKIVLFVPGDPLCATTHTNLIAEARQKKIKVKIIHNASIFSAIGETGLQLYNFGKTATIPFSGQTDSIKNTLKTNKKLGLHTLLLLDLNAKDHEFMHPEVGLQLLVHKKIINEKDLAVIASRLGKNSDIKFGTVSQLLKTKMDTPAAIVIPGKLHFAEKEFLYLFSVKKIKNQKIHPEKIVKDVTKELGREIHKGKKIVKRKVGRRIKKYTKKINRGIKLVKKLKPKKSKKKKSKIRKSKKKRGKKRGKRK